MRSVAIGEVKPVPPPPPMMEFKVDAVLRSQQRHLAQTLAGMGMVAPAEVVFTVYTTGKHLVSVTMRANDARDLAAALLAECSRAEQIREV